MRVDQLTFTRFLAAIAIVIFHYGHETFFFTNEFLEKIFSQANIGVSYFFVLSGFVMVIAYRNRNVSIGEFYKNRIARIYPLYFFALLFLALFTKITGGNFYFGEFLISTLGIQSWLPNYPLSMNSPGWSISVEFFFYAVFPFLAKLIYKKNDKTYFFLVFLFWATTQVVFNFYLKENPDSFFVKSHLIYYFPLLHLNQFLIGTATGMLFLKKKETMAIKKPAVIILLLLTVLMLLLLFPLTWDYHNGLLSVLFAPLIFMLSLDKGAVSQLFCRKPFVFLGEVSYGIYILQLPVYHLYKMVSESAGMKFNFWGYLVFLLIFSGITYLFIEKPMRQYISKFEIKNLKLRLVK